MFQELELMRMLSITHRYFRIPVYAVLRVKSFELLCNKLGLMGIPNKY